MTGTLVSHKLPTDSDPISFPGLSEGCYDHQRLLRATGSAVSGGTARMMMNGGDHVADRLDHLPVAGKADEKQMMSVSPLRIELSG